MWGKSVYFSFICVYLALLFIRSSFRHQEYTVSLNPRVASSEKDGIGKDVFTVNIRESGYQN